MTQALHDKVVILTGAGSGIGAATALALARAGARLVLAARGAEALEAVAAQCRALGAQTLVVPTDVTDEAACAALCEAAVAAFGAIDVLINNAGISMWARFDEVEDLSSMRRIMEVNYYGSVHCTAHALPHLKRSRGRLVGVASLTGVTGVPTRTFYAASKHAMMGFFDSLRIELADTGVSVTMVCPGFVATEIARFDPKGGKADGALVDASRVMTAPTCADIIVAATAARKRQVIMTAKGKLGRWLKLVAPGLVDNLARKTIDRGH